MMRAMTATTLREEHANVTRQRILAAVAELLERGGPEELTVPDVAEASGVSLRTVYRYYPTRDELLEAAGRWIGAELLHSPYPQTLDEVATVIADGCRRFDDHPGLVRSLALSELGRDVRATRRGERLAAIEQALRAEVGGLPEDELRRAQAILGYLHNMLAYTTLREEGGLNGEQAGEAVAWAIGTLVEDLRRRHASMGGTQ
jgi:AcrR family transcriptional regulator